MGKRGYMNIAHLIDSGGMYGAEQVLLTLCKQQQLQGLNPVIVSCGLPGEKEKPLEQNAREQGIPLLAWRMSAGINLAGMRELHAELISRKVQLFHSHGYKFNILLALLVSRKSAIPMVSTVHGYVKAKFPRKMWLYELFDRIALRRFDKIILVSEQMRQLAAFSGSSSKIEVINNGIAAESAQSSSVHLSGLLELVAIGRLSPEKGFNYLIDAVAELNREQPTCRLTLMGTGGQEAALKTHVEQAGQKEYIHFKGFVANAQAQFHQFNLVVMPSLTEGIPVTLLEAMRNQTPIIASAVGGIPYVLGEDYPLLIVPASVDSIVNKCRKWLQASIEEREQLIRRNHARYLQSYTAEIMAVSYLAIYQDLIAQRKC